MPDEPLSPELQKLELQADIAASVGSVFLLVAFLIGAIFLHQSGDEALGGSIIGFLTASSIWTVGLRRR